MSNPRDELVRIDGQGVAHPIGPVASQRLRRHTGAYRLLPSPDHVIFMRFTGEDGRVDEGDGAIVRLAGEIVAPGTLSDILSLLAQTGWRGVLVVHSESIVRRIFLDQGSVLGAQSNDPQERLGQVMYRYGHVSEDALAQVELDVQAGRRFGEALLERGLVTQENLYQAFLQQMSEIVFGAMHVADGTFFFLDQFEDSELATRQSLSVNNLLMAGVTRLDEMRYFEEKIPSTEHIPQHLPNAQPPAEEYQALYQLIDGSSSIRDLGRKTGRGEFDTIKKLYALVQSKHVLIHPPRVSGGPSALASAANDVLWTCFKRARDIGREQDLATSLDTFVVGAGVLYDMLFRGAGPDASGRLDVERLAQNAELLGEGSDAEHTLRKLLLDYVSFALFSVGAALGKEKEDELQRECDLALSTLRHTS